MQPKHARPDPNQAELVLALRGLGCSVVDLHLVGKGCPDLLVGIAGHTILVEVKKPRGPKGGDSDKGQKLNENQIAFHADWKGAPIHVLRTLADAGALVRAATGEKGDS